MVRPVMAFAVVGLITVFSPVVSSGQDGAKERATLAGLGGVHVIVEDLHDDLKRGGLSETILRTDVELRLRSVGIRVMTETEHLAVRYAAFVHVAVAGLQAQPLAGYVATVNVSLMQHVRLERDQSIRILAATWSATELVTGPSTEIIRRSVRDLVDGFANAYLAANPK